MSSGGQLWNAVDQTSSQLIQTFYTNLQVGMDKAEAMRQAKLKLIRSDPDPHPYSWAPFIVIGDAAPLGQ
jgi:CHAT domain-containing protein